MPELDEDVAFARYERRGAVRRGLRGTVGRDGCALRDGVHPGACPPPLSPCPPAWGVLLPPPPHDTLGLLLRLWLRRCHPGPTLTRNVARRIQCFSPIPSSSQVIRMCYRALDSVAVSYTLVFTSSRWPKCLWFFLNVPNVHGNPDGNVCCRGSYEGRYQQENATILTKCERMLHVGPSPDSLSARGNSFKCPYGRTSFRFRPVTFEGSPRK